MAQVEVPGRGMVEFPDTMSRGDMAAAIKRLGTGVTPGTPEPPAPGPAIKAAQAASGASPAPSPAPMPANAPARAGGLGPIPIIGTDIRELAAQPIGQRLQDWAIDSGLQIGMMGAPIVKQALAAVPVLRRRPAGVSRVVMGALGAEIGGDVTGAGLGTGGERGLTGAAIGEGLVGGAKIAAKVPGVVRAVTPGRLGESMRAKATANARMGADVTAAEGKVAAAEQAQAGTQAAAGSAAVSEGAAQRASQELAADVGTKVGAIAPPMAAAPGATTAERANELSNMGTFRGQQRIDLGAYQAQRLAEAEGMLPPGTTIRVPALGRDNPQWIQTAEAMGMSPDRLPPMLRQEFERNFGPRMLDRFTLTEVAEQMKQLGQRGFAGRQASSETRNIVGRSLRQQYGQIMDEVQQELTGINPAAWDAFREGRHAFSVGNEILRVLRNQSIWLRNEAGAALDPAKFQTLMRENAGRIRERMSPAEWQDFQRVVWKGGEIAAQDAPSLAGARKAAGAAAEAVKAASDKTGAQRAALAALPRPQVKAPWGQDDIARIMFDAAVTRALSGLGPR